MSLGVLRDAVFDNGALIDDARSSDNVVDHSKLTSRKAKKGPPAQYGVRQLVAAFELLTAAQHYDCFSLPQS
jgi:hypothetical protein